MWMTIRSAIPLLTTFALLTITPHSHAADLHLDWDLSIGGSEDEFAALIGHATDVVVDSSGRIYVADMAMGHQCIHKLDADGSYIKRLGQPGDGPGDIMFGVVMAIDDSDRLYITGFGNRVDILDTDGNFLDSFPRENSGGVPRSISVGPDGEVVIAAMDVINQTTIDRYDSRHRHVRSFSDSFGVGKNLDWRLEDSYGGGFAEIDLKGNVLFTQLAPFEIRAFSPADELLFKTTSGGEAFVPPPPRPETNESGFTVRHPWASTGIVVLPEIGILNSAYRKDGDDVTTLLTLHDHDGALKATKELAGLRTIVGSDREGRVFFYTRDEEAPRVERGHLVLSEE